MKKNIIYNLLAGAAVMAGFTSCDNDEFLDVTHYNILAQSAMYESDANAKAALNGVYDMVLPSNYDSDNDGETDHCGDPYKPYIFTGLHPTMDTQATGWDKDFMTQSWTAEESNLKNGWNHAYAAISRANDFLAGLEGADALTPSVKKSLEGEGRALRAYFYHWLATTFGRVPMLATGESYANAPAKARAQSYEEMWDFIIEDLEAAADLLDWKPMDNQYGRCTKGMALAYLGDAYMWKAYRCPETAADSYAKAKAALKSILDSGTYKLNDSYTTLWDADEAWGSEAIWQQVLNEGDQWGGWDGSKWSEAHGWVGFYCGAPANGAWGTMALSWELYDSFEDGDKRRDGSLVTACIPTEELKRVGKERWAQKYINFDAFLNDPANEKYIGVSKAGSEQMLINPDCPIGYNPFAQEVVFYNTFHREASEPAPTVYSTKHWRNGRGTHRQGDQWLPAHVYQKRLANVMLDYAECCFRTGEEAKGWEQVNALRNRAFGNLEVGKKAALTSKFTAYFNSLNSFYGDNGMGNWHASTEYPYIFSEETVEVPDAKTYYTARKAQLEAEPKVNAIGKAEESKITVWQVAVNEERRKEFNAEWCLRTDMQKSGYLVYHIEHNYPKGYGVEAGEEQLNEWRTYRGFDFDIDKMDMPIPSDELIKNPLCDQNPAYVSK